MRMVLHSEQQKDRTCTLSDQNVSLRLVLIALCLTMYLDFVLRIPGINSIHSGQNSDEAIYSSVH